MSFKRWASFKIPIFVTLVTVMVSVIDYSNGTDMIVFGHSCKVKQFANTGSCIVDFSVCNNKYM